MFNVKNGNISMVEGDYGLELPITITGTIISSDETIELIIRDNSGEIKIDKFYNNIVDNTINFSLTKQESGKLTSNKKYFYSLDWYRNEDFLGNILNGLEFNVEEKK